MKIQIASDLHLEFLSRFPRYRVIEPADADVLVIAGDIHNGAKALRAFEGWPVPVIYVHGNHEMYDQHYQTMLLELRGTAAALGIHFLENDELILDGVRFLGCCLWTDYELYGTMYASMLEAERNLADHRAIRFADRLFIPPDALSIHMDSRHWLSHKLQEDFPGKTVVVTHHGPHEKSVHPKYTVDPITRLLNAAFVSDLTPELEDADLWIHGHTHDSFDYEVEGCRVIANPRGYPMNRPSAKLIAELTFENKSFDPRLVVEI
jgi:predicted phosphodiesterase